MKLSKIYQEKLILIIILAIAIRGFTFFVVLLSDSRLWIEASTLLVNGINPYETNVDFFYKYPPLFYYVLNLFGILTNFSYFGPKLMIFCFDVFNIIIIYKIGAVLKNRVLGLNAALFYALNPIIILQFYHDVNEFVTLCFTLLAVYFLITEKLVFSSISLALGIGFKLYPTFFLIPITIYLYKNLQTKKIKSIFKYYSIILISIILISLPFLLLSPVNFLQRLFIHTSRINLGGSITEQIPELLILFDPAVEIFGITFSYQFFIQAGVMLFIFFFFFFTKKEFNTHDLFTVMVIITLILPLINYQIQLKYLNLMSFPFLLFILYKDLKSVKEKELYFLYLINFLSILSYFIVFIFAFPPFENLINLETSSEKGTIYIYWFICSIIFFINEYKHREEREYKVLILNVLPFLFYYIFANLLGVFLACGLLILTILYISIKYWWHLRAHEIIFISSIKDKLENNF